MVSEWQLPHNPWGDVQRNHYQYLNEEVIQTRCTNYKIIIRAQFVQSKTHRMQWILFHCKLTVLDLSKSHAQQTRTSLKFKHRDENGDIIPTIGSHTGKLNDNVIYWETFLLASCFLHFQCFIPASEACSKTPAEHCIDPTEGVCPASCGTCYCRCVDGTPCTYSGGCIADSRSESVIFGWGAINKRGSTKWSSGH